MRQFQPELLRKLRLNRGFSLEMTARVIGLRAASRVTRSAVSHWERGKATPSVENLLALGEIFQVPVDYFFDPLPKYLFGNTLPHTRKNKPPLPELEMLLEPGFNLTLPDDAVEPLTDEPDDDPRPAHVAAVGMRS